MAASLLTAANHRQVGAESVRLLLGHSQLVGESHKLQPRLVLGALRARAGEDAQAAPEVGELTVSVLHLRQLREYLCPFPVHLLQPGPRVLVLVALQSR